LYEYLNSL